MPSLILNKNEIIITWDIVQVNKLICPIVRKESDIVNQESPPPPKKKPHHVPVPIRNQNHFYFGKAA